jgi:hypothetical protein
MEMNFSFILLLALCPIEDLHIKLRRAIVIVEQKEEALMQIVMFCETGQPPLKNISPSLS